VSSIFPAAASPTEAGAPRENVRIRTIAVFLAALGPMLTVPALRKLLIEEHGATPAALHMFVAAGMIGSAIGAPLVAARADRRGDHMRVAVVLAAIDALVGVVTSSHVPTALLFALRPIHGLASMALLSLLFGEFRRSRADLVACAGGAMVAALAIGPAVGGALTRLGPHVPFRAAALVSMLVAVVVASRGASYGEAVQAESAPASACTRSSFTSHGLLAPLVIVMTQRFAIGGLVTAFAVRARAVHGLSDAHVGACFSVLLVVFGVTVFTIGRKLTGRALAAGLPAGAALFGASFAALAVVPRPLLPLALAGAGFGAALVYAPCLDLVSSAAPGGRRATSMALLHSAGAVGMILGPLFAALLEVVLSDWSAPQRCAAFMTFAGVIHAAVAIALSSRCRAIAAGSTSNAFNKERANS
jgi:MFS family permease